MGNTTEVKDLIAFHPGAYVEEIVDDLNITQAEFAERLGVSSKIVSNIINGQDSVSAVTADKLAKVTGVSTETWLNLQAQYDAKIAKS
ncbi:addiction module antidote protein, HigA family [Levilactobacillus brevis]|nr:addiction module antidote protein, HigA family [Levilactobacillus brevis]